MSGAAIVSRSGPSEGATIGIFLGVIALGLAIAYPNIPTEQERRHSVEVKWIDGPADQSRLVSTLDSSVKGIYHLPINVYHDPAVRHLSSEGEILETTYHESEWRAEK